MESPVVVENCAQFSYPENSGFPFDEGEYDSAEHSHPFQSRLNDLAARHPEFASHFRGFDDFPSLRRKQRQPNQHQDPETAAAGSSSSRTFPSSAFNRFPFTSRFHDDFPEQGEAPPAPTPAPQSASKEKPPEVPKEHKDTQRGRKPNPHLPQHLSNTVDLGKQQLPTERSQRSMSAPPENRTTRVDPDIGPEDMGHKFTRQTPPQQQQQQPPNPQPKERIIPIHVEGRDDPVMPKNPNIPTERKQDPNAHIRRQAYEQFVPQKPPPQQPQTPQPQPQNIPQPQSQTPPPQFKKDQTPPLSNDPLDKIKSVRSDVMALMTNVENFAGTRKDKEYLYLDEMLTRNLLKLDNVETEGKENIRLARKEAIKCIQTCISNLEAKAQAKEMSLKNSETSETQVSVQETPQDTETSSIESEPQKFTSQATLIISPQSEPQQKQQKIEEQAEKMDAESTQEPETSSQQTN